MNYDRQELNAVALLHAYTRDDADVLYNGVWAGSYL